MSKEIEEELYQICAATNGEYLDPQHPKTSWATSYGNEFIEATAKLWKIYKGQSGVDPTYKLSKEFIGRGITSCRGSKMTTARVDYLYSVHIRNRLNG